jgi:hypothetical protein
MKNEELTMKNGSISECPEPPLRTPASSAVNGRSIVNGQSSIGNFFRLLAATFREIFDENAYSRFLARNALPSTGESFRAFQRENAIRRERRARCC